MKKVVIIGSNSFSGSSFTDYLLNKNYKVIGISRSSESNFFFSRYSYNIKKKNFKFFKCNLNKDLSKIIEIIDKFKPEIIINFSAQSMVNESWNKPLDWYETNVIASISLFENLMKKKYLKKFIQFSTPEVYGSTSTNIKENNSFNPSTPYALSRATSDAHINLINKEFGFPSIITRASNVYGEFQKLYRIVPLTIFKIIKKDKLYLHGGGMSKRSFIHINDVNSALYQLINKGEVGNTYHISTHKKISILELVTLICKKMNYNLEDLIIKSEDRIGKDKNYFLDSSKLRRQTGWQDKISIDEGVGKVIDWSLNNIGHFNKLQTKYVHKK